MSNIYDNIENQLKEIDKKLIDSEGEITEEIQGMLLLVDIDSKNLIKWMLSKYLANNSEINNIEERIRHLKNKKISAEKQVDYWAKNIEKLMKRYEFKKLTFPEADISFRKGRTLIIEDENMIPDSYYIEKKETKLDKITLNSDLRDGKIVPGAKLSDYIDKLQIKI